MSAWDIRPSEVLTVLETVMGHVGEEGGGQGLVGGMERLETNLTDASEHAASPVVSMALGEFAEHVFGITGDMVRLTGSGIQGAGEATDHYNNGNLEMAAESQANAVQVPPDAHHPNL